MKRKNTIIAIDGPAGAGKSTIAKKLASDLGFVFIDSGAMYRAVTLYMLENDLFDLPEPSLKKHLKKLQIEFKNSKSSETQLIFLNGKNISKKIRTSKVSKNVSVVAAKKVVREDLVKRQKELGNNINVVMDGRDIGTVVFPDADLKIYLTASSEVRAKRRQKDLKALGEKVSIKDLIKQINDRDNFDSSRTNSPLTKPQDAIVIDTSNKTINKVLDEITSFLPCSLHS